jgi:hypothetical protein
MSRATSIVTAMSANSATFKAPTIAFTIVTGHVTNLGLAEAAFKAHTGTLADRNTQVQLVIADCKQLFAYVQQLVTASPSEASTIAADAAMTLRKAGSHPKSDLKASQKVSSIVDVVAKATKGGRSYEWQYSTDGGKTWLGVPPTTKASVSIPNLQPGVMTQFRQRAVTKAGPTDWSNPVSTLVT